MGVPFSLVVRGGILRPLSLIVLVFGMTGATQAQTANPATLLQEYQDLYDHILLQKTLWHELERPAPL
jgi:hypothetical protein